MKRTMLALCLFSLSTLYSAVTFAQKTEKTKNTDPEIIYLENPSFEDIPSAGRTPYNWMDYGPATETPPDIQPYGGFRVTKAAFHGNTYLGLVTRDHNTWESVGQKLSKPMKKDQCYDFSLVAARSEVYESATKHNSQKLVNFNKGVTVRVFGANSAGERTELLAATDVIENTDWQTYKLKLKPSNDYNYIVIEAFYKTPTLFPYNGNVLIDNLSPITPCIINNTPEPIIAEKEPAVTPTKPSTTPVVPPSTNPTTPPSVVKQDTTPKTPILPKEDKGNFSNNIKTQDLKVGDIFRLSNLYFAADSTNINKVSENSLMELHTFLKNNPQVIIEIGGHTNGLPTHEYCDKLSTERAQRVADFLITRGIPASQVQSKGYGKRKPIDTDSTALGRERNQRVEIKILNINK